MAVKAKSIKDIAAKIYANKITVDGAAAAIREAELARLVEPHMPHNDETIIFATYEDDLGPEDNDVVYLDALRSSGTISIAEFDELVDALNSRTEDTSV